MVISEVILDIYILYLALISQLEEELSNSSINLTNDYKGSLHIPPQVSYSVNVEVISMIFSLYYWTTMGE